MSPAPNRIVVIDETGVLYDRTGVTGRVFVQDDGLTIKVFLEASDTAAKDIAAHQANMKKSLVVHDEDA